MDTEDKRSARKRALIEEGSVCRIGIVHARHTLGQALQPDVLARHAAEHALVAVRTRVDRLFNPLDIKALAPLVLGVVGLVRRRRLGRPVLAAAALAALGWCWQHFKAEPR